MSDNEFEEDLPTTTSKIESKRIFINHVDTYNGRNLAKFLSKCVIGSSQDGGEEAAGEEEADASGGAAASKKDNTYKIYGTLSSNASGAEYKRDDSVKEIVNGARKEDLLEQLLECDVIIYDIIQDAQQVDEACWAITALHNELERIDKPKVFILLSTVMTWSKTKPVDPDESDIPFTEEDFRRRKPHPNYKEHLAAEKTVIKCGKTNKKKLASYVVCSGLIYGQEENIFHYLFKSAWHNNELVLYGKGKNVLPTIHINDLASVMHNISDQRPKVRYLVVVDDSKTTLKQITKAVSKNLGTGKFKAVLKEDALLNKEITQGDFDMLLMDLKMDAAYIKENMQIKWSCESGFVENIQKLVKEYKQSRNLIPFKVCILGPPGVGKSTVAQQLAAHYKVHHIHAKDVITQAIDNLNKLSKRAEQETEKLSGDDATADGAAAAEEEEIEEEEEEEEMPDFSDLEAINEQLESNNGRLDDQLVIKFFKERLLSKPCQNQGFILDGFPKTREQAQALFEPDEQEEEEETANEEDAKEPKFHKLITPDLIIKLDASDDFLCKRIMNLPEKLVQDTHNTEEGVTRRLAEYRDNNNEDNTVTNVFEEDFDLGVVKLPCEAIESDKSLLHRSLVDTVRTNYMKEPRNYGLSKEEKAELKRVELETRMVREREEQEERERLEAEESTERIRKQTEWQEKLELIKKEELEYLETQSVPLRNYLMTHVMPTLTKGLIECCKHKPEDPIDYLAEYLFKNNQQVD